MESQDQCYICCDVASDEAPFMDPNPCTCRGSIKMHWSCFAEYRRQSGRCGACKTAFSMQVNATGSLILIEEDTHTYINTKGKIIGFGPVKSGLKNGHWKIFHQTTGTLKEEGQFINGKTHGTWTAYYESGLMKSETKYAHGAKNGLFKSYHENGVLESQGTLKTMTYSSHIMKIGEWKSYYDSSILKSIAN